MISKCAAASTSSARSDICFLTRCQAPPLAPGPRRTFEFRSWAATSRGYDYSERQSLDPLVAPVADFHGAAKVLGIIDWSQGPVAEVPQALQKYQVSFYSEELRKSESSEFNPSRLVQRV